MFLSYCTSEKCQEEERTEITKVGDPKNKRFFDFKSPKVNVFLKEVKDSKEMKDLMKEIQDKMKVVADSFESRLKEMERKAEAEMKRKLDEMNDLLKCSREEFDQLVEYGNQTKGFMSEHLIKVTSTGRAGSMPDMSGRYKANESETGTTQAPGSVMTAATKCFNCGEYGHLGCDCPRQGTNLKMCYECRQFVTHRVAQCPLRMSKSKEKRYGNKNYNNRGSRGNRRGRGGNNYRSGTKRPSESQNDSNAKRGRFNNREKS
ncbi:uncharacterized protein LOC100679740 isoform X1 [Nasonia vitripennis]|uniref:CCHC-type domain-containing protein n=1 Tax=Nasonia vitripennis TaxID=7425 RepID=A0A7M7R465_NASVI|nr:uncharacterized protein LOC100679740 isoform X1 [Nasonia vitripennis]